MDTKNLSSNQISSFLNSLSYWESINLRSTLLKAQNKGMSSEDAYEQATLDYEGECQESCVNEMPSYI